VKLARRKFLHVAAGVAILPAATRLASALDYPARPVRIIVGFPAGYATDIVARLVAQSLSERLGEQVFVENHPGAATNIAVGEVVNATPDGYTLLAMTVTNAVNATLYKNLHFATKRAFRSRISKFAFRGPLVIVDGAHELAGALIHVNAADCPTQISAKHDEGKLEFA